MITRSNSEAVCPIMATATYPGAQTERRGGAGPVGGLLGGKDPTGRLFRVPFSGRTVGKTVLRL
jgi:hypothetical protein